MAQEDQDIAVGPAVPQDQPDAARCASSGEVSIPAAAACLSCLAGGWIAAGSVGMLDDTLRHALMWAAFALAVFADRVFRPRRTLPALVLIVGGVFVVVMGASGLSELNVLAAALLAALLAPTKDAPARRALVTVAQALVVLALWRLLVSSVPVLWVAADRLGWLLGLAGSAAADHPLWTGATFGGVDFLITMLALLAGYLPAMRRRRVSRGLLIFFAIAAGHLLYLVVLALCPQIVSALPDTARRGWDWASAVRSVVPWNVPALAGAIDLAIAAAIIRWSTWPAPGITPHGVTTNGITRHGVTTNEITPHGVTTNGITPHGVTTNEITPHGVTTNEITPHGVTTNEITPHGVTTNGITPDGVTTNGTGRLRLVGLTAAIVVAAALPVAATFSPGPCSLVGKKFLALDSPSRASSQPAETSPASAEAAPRRLRADGESFGVGDFVKNLGGRWSMSAELSRADLADVNVLIVLAPNRPWGKGQLAMIDKFIRSGGSLLVAGSRDPGANGPCDELLALAGMRIRPGKTRPAVDDRLPFIEPLSHPATGGIGGADYKIGCCASLELGFADRPILTERWVWADADDAAGEAPNGRYDAGEKLGDLVIAAERELDKGTVVALADTAALTDLTLVRSSEFPIRLMGHLAARPASPAAWWRQAVSLLAGLLLVILLVGRAGAFRPAVAAIILAACLWASTQVTSRRCSPWDDGAGLTTSRMTHGKSAILPSCEDGRFCPEFNAAPAGPGNVATGFAALHPWLQACAPTGLKAPCSLSMYSGLPEAPVADLRNRPARLPQTAGQARRPCGLSLAVLRDGEARP